MSSQMARIAAIEVLGPVVLAADFAKCSGPGMMGGVCAIFRPAGKRLRIRSLRLWLPGWRLTADYFYRNPYRICPLV